MKKSITIAAAALLSAVSAGAAFAAAGDREYYAGATRSTNMERGYDSYGAPAATFNGGAVDSMSTGSIYRDGAVNRPSVYGDGNVNKTYEPGEGDYYEGLRPR